MPQSCVNVADVAVSLPVNSSVPSNDRNATGLAALGNFGCYLSNDSAMVPITQGTYGNMARNQLRSPGFGEWDLSLDKNWTVKERVKMQFRAEGFNILSSAILAGPRAKSSAFTNPNKQGRRGGLA
jgi:hypothetical protein